jgi:hypothetical protein
MSNGAPTNLKPSHLLIAIAPEQLEGQPSIDLSSHFEKGMEHIDHRLQLSERWRERIRIRPVPPQPKTLAELVEAARRRLREDRLRDDRDELTARRYVLDRVITALRP